MVSFGTSKEKKEEKKERKKERKETNNLIKERKI